MLVEPLTIDGRRTSGTRGFNVNGHPLCVEAIGKPFGGADHFGGSRAGADANEEPFVRGPGCFISAAETRRFNLFVDTVGRFAEGDLAEGNEVLLAEKLLQGLGGLCGNVNLSLPQSL